MKPLNRILLAALMFIPWAALRAADAPPKPNIVFIFADDWGWGDLGCHGHPYLKTPNLDRLASEGIDFQQFNVLNPVCSPSRAAVMTGQYPARYCIHQHFAAPESNARRGMPDWLDPKAPSLPRFLKQAGYRTAHFGKWHLTNRETHGAPTPDAYGYDEAKVFNGGAQWPSADLHAAADDAVTFIKANAGTPFFINVWLHESHTPHVPTKESMQRWKHLDEQQQVYAAVITDGDNAVGKILTALKDAGVEDNTLVMFSSDNGPESTGPNKNFGKDGHTNSRGYGNYYCVGSTGGLRGRKRSLFEGGVRVPFIVRWPGHTPAGVLNDKTVFTAVDLLPTLCAAAGVTLPADYQGDGENLLDAFEGKAIIRKSPIFWEWRGNRAEPDWWPRLAVREGDWKLALTHDATRVELHRLTDDRAEAADVSRQHPDVVARLTKLALDWKGTLPESPDPDCIQPMGIGPRDKATVPGTGTSKVTPEQRARAFERWDTNKHGVLTLDEYKAGLRVQAQQGPRWVLPEPDAPRMQRVIFDSKAAGEKVSCYVFTPQPYDTDQQRRFPVLYWLHGSGGSSPGSATQVAQRYAEAMRAGKIPPMILVFPNGLPRGMWCDWKDGSVKLETMFIEELIPHIDRTFRTVAKREGRIIEGFSMGGYGSARLGFKHPHLFAAVSLFGAGPLQAELTETPRAGSRERERLLSTVYGGDMAYYREQSPWHIVERNAEKLRTGLLIRQIVGDRDETFGFNREFKQHLDALKIPHTFRQLPGIPHAPNLVLNTLGEDNWEFYRSAFRLTPETDRPDPNPVEVIDPDNGVAASARSVPPILIADPTDTKDCARIERTRSGVASMAITQGGRIWVAWYVGATPGAKIDTRPNAYLVDGMKRL